MKRAICCSFLLVFLLLPARAVEPETSLDQQRAADLHRDYTFESFADHPDASAPISFEEIDYELLAAAVFHETNRRRAAHDLPILSYRRELVEAAAIQAQGMKRTGTVSHQHPDEELKTLADRVEQVGLRPAFSAENVAMTFGIRYEAGRPVVPREENDATLFSYEPGGEPIEPHTYLSYAEALLEKWMDSPGHRRNILHDEPEELGAANVHATSELGMDVFYSVQVFFTELDVPPGAKVITEPGE